MAKSIEIPTIDLAGDVAIPQFGLGVFQVPPEETFENVTHGIEAGYRHIDTAKAYGNEAEVGQAVHASSLPREAFFITTKLLERRSRLRQPTARSRRASAGSRWSTSTST